MDVARYPHGSEGQRGFASENAPLFLLRAFFDQHQTFLLSRLLRGQPGLNLAYHVEFQTAWRA